MTLKEIYEQDWEQDTPGFKTKQTNIDPITGQITWDVEYTPLTDIDKSIEDVYSDFKEALRKHPEDQKLEQLFDSFAAWKREFRRHISRKYGR